MATKMHIDVDIRIQHTKLTHLDAGTIVQLENVSTSMLMPDPNDSSNFFNTWMIVEYYNKHTAANPEGTHLVCLKTGKLKTVHSSTRCTAYDKATLSLEKGEKR